MNRRAERGRVGIPWRIALRPLIVCLKWALDAAFFIPAWPVALVARFLPKRIDVGIGPEPLVNNIYHKRALSLFGYTAETFVDQVWHITSDFDYRGDLKFSGLLAVIRPYALLVRALFRYRCLYVYFNGGPLMSRPLTWRMEPLLLRTARVRVVVMPYGGDVQVMSRSRNLWFKNAMAKDYPDYRLRQKRVARQLHLWTTHADHVIGGVEWVDYMYHWDTLMLGHFAIDTAVWSAPLRERTPGTPFRVLHAPNHRHIKGTQYFIEAVEQLRQEGIDIELLVLERVSNEEIREAMCSVDAVADQLIIGWYAMFAIEAMAMGRPVLCYLREDLLDLYTVAGLLGPGEMPIVNCSPLNVKDVLRELVQNREKLHGIAERGRRFVEAHHSLKAVGTVFDHINRGLGISPSQSPSVQDEGRICAG